MAATAVGLCGAGAVAAPRLLPLAEQGLQHAALDAAQGELRQLEGVSLDAAIKASELTRAAAHVIALPVHTGLSLVHAPTNTVDQLRVVVASWESGIDTLPIALDAYVTGRLR